MNQSADTAGRTVFFWFAFAHRTARSLRLLAFIALIACSLVVDRAWAQPPEVRQRIAAVEDGLVPAKGGARVRILDRMQQLKVPGASVAVIRGFKVDWAKGYGVADRQTGAPVTTRRCFRRPRRASRWRRSAP